MENYQKDSNLTLFKKKNIVRIAKAALHNFTGKCSLDCNDVFPVCPVRPLYPVSDIFLLMISYYLLAYQSKL